LFLRNSGNGFPQLIFFSENDYSGSGRGNRMVDVDIILLNFVPVTDVDGIWAITDVDIR